MKEMIYSAEQKKEVLFSGEYKGHKFCIMNLGTHPTAYVENKIKNLVSYDDDRLYEIDVHGVVANGLGKITMIIAVAAKGERNERTMYSV